MPRLPTRSLRQRRIMKHCEGILATAKKDPELAKYYASLVKVAEYAVRVGRRKL